LVFLKGGKQRVCSITGITKSEGSTKLTESISRIIGRGKEIHPLETTSDEPRADYTDFYNFTRGRGNGSEGERCRKRVGDAKSRTTGERNLSTKLNEARQGSDDCYGGYKKKLWEVRWVPRSPYKRTCAEAGRGDLHIIKGRDANADFLSSYQAGGKKEIYDADDSFA